MKWPLVTRRRYARELNALNTDRERLRGERDGFACDRDAFKAAGSAALRLYGAADASGQRGAVRLRRAVRALARYRADLAAAERTARNLQRRLDQLLGLDSPAITAGADWQKRREDKKEGSLT